jgi:tRNA dimethylallyltransferase
MQVYRELRVLTARPSPQEEASVPHRLYGVRPAAQAANTAWWRAEALAAIAEARNAGKLPILCGGTGLYFLALARGLVEVPPVPGWARDDARTQLAASGSEASHARLAELDPATAARLRPSDGQRVARALEVVLGTGQGLAAWRAGGIAEGEACRLSAVLLRPPREELRTVVAERFDRMLSHGGIEEARALLGQGLDPALPAMRAHGVPELVAHLAGRMTLSDARERAIANTRRYVKRQDTWFRHQPLASKERACYYNARFSDVEQFTESLAQEILAVLRLPR